MRSDPDGMVLDNARSAESALKEKWPIFRKHPELLLDSELIRLKSDTKVNADGEEIRAEDGFLVPMQRTIFQKRLHATKLYCRELGMATLADICKSRRVRATTGILSGFLSEGLTKDGIGGAVFGLTDDSAENLFKLILDMWDNMLLVKQFITTKHRAKDMLEFYSDVSPFNVRGSQFLSYTANESAVNKARGLGLVKILFSEAAYYPALGKLSAPVNAALFRSKYAEFWRETTPNGLDNEYAADFLDNWQKGGACNWWEPGFKHIGEGGSWSRISIFFPAFADPSNQQPLFNHKGVKVTPDDLIHDLDDYESWLFSHAIEYWMNELRNFIPSGMKMTENQRRDVAKRHAVLHLNFRRSKLRSLYPNVPVLPSAGYSQESDYNKEYPNTPQEAFSGSGVGTSIPPKVLSFVKSGVVNPIYDGLIVESRKSNRMFEFVSTTEGDICSTRVFRDPAKCEGPFLISIDPHPGKVGAWSIKDYQWDFTWMTAWDLASGEQVLEHVTQEIDAIWHQYLWTLCKYLAMNASGIVTEERLPMVAEEAFTSASGMNYLWQVKKYPVNLLLQMPEVDSIAFANVRGFGFKPNRKTKPMAVANLQTALQAGMSFNSLGDEERKSLLAAPRMFVRSKYVADQLGWFVAKKKGENTSHEALYKGRNSEKSVDDGVSASYVAAFFIFWYYSTYGAPNVDSFFQLNKDEDDKGEQVFSTSEMIEMEMRSPAGDGEPRILGFDEEEDDDVFGDHFSTEVFQSEY